MYWLSCPSLKAAVSQLENQGLVSDWEQRLQASGCIAMLLAFSLANVATRVVPLFVHLTIFDTRGYLYLTARVCRRKNSAMILISVCRRTQLF